MLKFKFKNTKKCKSTVGKDKEHVLQKPNNKKTSGFLLFKLAGTIELCYIIGKVVSLLWSIQSKALA